MVRLRLAALIGLLALLPMGAYFLLNGTTVTLITSGVSVLLVVGSLWLMVADTGAHGASPEP